MYPRLWLRYSSLSASSEDYVLEELSNRQDDLVTRNNNTNEWICVDKYVVGFIVCSLIAAIGSEFMQSSLTHGKRAFDPSDILCNFTGSSIGICIAFIAEKFN